MRGNHTERLRTTPPLVGRDEELHRLVAAVANPPGVAVIEGEAGIGKTRLVGELAARLDSSGRRMLLGGCRQIREPFPLGPVLDALRGIGDVLLGRRLSAVVGALRPLLPELAEHLPDAPEPLEDRAAERHRVFRALVSLLAEVDHAVLVVEDAHWADEQTVDFLGYLLADPPPALCVVLTYRGEEADEALRAVTTRLAAEVGREHIVLPLLDPDQTSALAAAILDTGQSVSRNFAIHLWERTSGLPFAVQELLALLRERGMLVRRERGWSRRAIDELDVPAGVRHSVLERVRWLTPAGQAVAEAAAVLRERVSVKVLTATCQVPRADALEGLEEALASGLLEERGSTVGFRHMLAAQSVYASLPLPRRQDLHGRAATAVRSLVPPPLGQVAHHLREAHLYDQWVDAAEAAAEQAAELNDDTEAARVLEDVLRTAPLDPARRGALTIKLGWVAIEARHFVAVLDLFEQALALEQPRAVRGQLRFFTIPLQEQLAAEPAVLWRTATAALEDLEGQPELSAWAMLSLALPYGLDPPAAEHLAWANRALELVPQIRDRAFAVFILGKVAMLLVNVGDPRWSELAEQVRELTGGTPVHTREVNAYASIAEAAMHVGNHAWAERLLDAAADAPVGPRLDLLTDALRLVLDHRRGRWDGLEEAAAPLRSTLRDRPGLWIIVESVSACLALSRGELDGVDARLSGAVEAALDASGVEVLPALTTAYLRLSTATGEADRALAATRDPLRLWEVKEMWPVAVRTLPALVEALLAVGRADEAAERLAGFEAGLRGRDAPFAPAALAHARGHLAAAAGDLPAAAEQFTTAAEQYAALPCPYEAAQATELAASCLFGAARPAEAADLLNSGLDTYRRLGAHWDLDRATRLARDHDLAPPSRNRGGRPSYGTELSPRERQVADLAASGMTNKEIGEALFVSDRTVEGHLGTVLRKLGLRSRTELAHRLNTDR